jgi:GNAT superfamily N-acetyltransferase
MDEDGEQLAEDALAFLAPRHGEAVLETEQYCLRHMPSPHPLAGYAARLRLGRDVEDTVAAVRAWFTDRGREEFLWLLGPSTTPRDLEARLTALGARPDAEDPVWAGMVLDEAPPSAPGIDVRKVEELDEAIRCVHITAADLPEAARAPAVAQVRAGWPNRNLEVREIFAAYIGGELVACATVAYLDRAVYLSGGATLPSARGRGAYRALVRARWDEAVRRGTPMLVVQAGRMSKPILERIGFRQVCEIQVLTDSARAEASEVFREPTEPLRLVR